jgi:hypothetical protein
MDERVTFPPQYILVRPGYLFNTIDKKLYSVKRGELRALSKQKGYYGSTVQYGPGYHISVNGVRHYLTQDYLEKFRPVTRIYPELKQPGHRSATTETGLTYTRI